MRWDQCSGPQEANELCSTLLTALNVGRPALQIHSHSPCKLPSASLLRQMLKLLKTWVNSPL